MSSGSSPDHVEQLVYPGVDPVPIPSEQTWHGGDVVRDRAAGEEPDLLDHVADLASRLGRRALANRTAAYEDVSLGDLHHAVDHPHGSRLPGARRADEDADLTCRDIEECSSAGESVPA